MARSSNSKGPTLRGNVAGWPSVGSARPFDALRVAFAQLDAPAQSRSCSTLSATPLSSTHERSVLRSGVVLNFNVQCVGGR